MKGEFVMLSKFISSLKQEFGGYNAAALTKDLMAGLTVAAVALPLALAFGRISSFQQFRYSVARRV